ncbi:MAG: hypothetical protein ACK5HS_04010, partial [Mycoplasmatales bacterium]
KYRKKNYLMTLIPGFLLFIVDMIYLITDKGIGFGMESRPTAFILATIISIIITVLILLNAKAFKQDKTNKSDDDKELETI